MAMPESIMYRAKEFTEEGSCYFHYENDNVTGEMAISGDPVKVLMGIERLITRLSDIVGGDFAETIEDIKTVHEMVAMNGGEGELD